MCFRRFAAWTADCGTEYPLEAFPLQGDMDKAKEYLDTALSELGLSSASDISLKLVVSDSDTAKKEQRLLQTSGRTIWVST